MVEVRGVIESFFITLKDDIYGLIRIEFLVAQVTVMFLAMFIMEIFCYQRPSSTITSIMETVNSLSDHILTYLLGAMQSAGFKNPLFPIWAIVLISLRGSLGYLSGYSIMDRERRLVELSSVLQFTAAGVLTGTPGVLTGTLTILQKPLWSLWAILALRGLYRYIAHGRAVDSLWHGRNSEFVPEDLRWKHADGSKDLGNGQNYLIYGESKQNITIQRPRYNLHLDVIDPDSLITLDTIRRKCPGNCIYKDMCLAFSLSRILRCRLEDASLHSESVHKTRLLIVSEIIGNQHAEQVARGFRILELELAFVRDYFYSLYPVIFWKGLYSLPFSLLQSITTVGIALWLAVELSQQLGTINSLYEDEGNRILRLKVGGCNDDVIMTWVFMFFVVFKEVWEMVTYLLSNWTRLLLVCKYVRSPSWFLGNAGLTKHLTDSFFTSKIADPRQPHIDQYEFLKSCTYKPTFWKLARTVTLGKTPQKCDGRKPGNPIRIYDCVKVAVIQELHRLLTSNQLHRDIPTLINPQIRFEKYEWAWFKLSKCSQSILVWHIATSLCETKLAKDKFIDKSEPSFLCSVWSCVKKWVCCSSQPFLIDDNISLQGQLQTNYRIATSLSRYCAYLLVVKPELLPDSFVVPQEIFEATLKFTCENLKDCNFTERYKSLMELAQEAVPDTERGTAWILTTNIVHQGAMLAKDLISEKEQDSWEILAGVWTKLLVHIAPSWNAEAHKDSLKSGCEFITLIWALLWHCGIEKSDMWKDDKEPESNGQAPQESSTGTENTRFVEEQDNEETELSEEPETSTLGEGSTQTLSEIEGKAQMEIGGRNILCPSRSTN
ncbi:hypothetical protein BS78_05G074800 [Paspalum vaginatum]|nr:hypothetical protein BS78_05G074800 [Paspalum vaginatum]KAJ1274611.1 hypothetical protein BS78_05G074800 [Paspalum vaginatum]KAJ1274612.1 hypothetical protein BS78_05G074800 [Paspalum vaginatum]